MTDINQRGRYGRYLQLLLNVADFLILNIAFFITAWILPDFAWQRPRTVWLLCNLSLIPASYWLGHMQSARIVGMEHVFGSAIKMILLHAPVFVVGLYFLQISHVPLKAFLLFYGLMILLLPTWWIVARVIIRHFRRRGRNYKKIAIVGTNPTACKLYETMSSDIGFGYNVVGFFDNDPQSSTPHDMYRGTLDDLETYATENEIDELYCALPGDCQSDVAHAMRIAETRMMQFFYVPPFLHYVKHTYEMYAIGAIPVMSVRHQPLSSMANRLVKRCFDVIFSSIVLILSPLFFIPVAIAIKVSSPGPVLFKQKRTGYRGRPFDCYKFRTMKVNADADTVQATKDDPRKTQVGDILRRTSIDELPQFINVFLGNMSVVGPRPHMLKHTEQYSRIIDKYMVRHTIKPGITGWAQISGFRGQTEELWQMEGRVEHDVWYIEHWSLLLDLKIIIRTILNAIHGEKNAF